MSDSLWPHEPQHTRPPCPSPTPGVYSNSWPSSRWWHPAISSSVDPFSSCPQSFSESGSFQMSQLFTLGSQSIGVSASASILPANTQDWSPLAWAGWISLQSKRLSRGIGEFNSDDHYIYYCGQESRIRNGKAIIVNESPKCSTWMQSQKWQNDLCSFPRQTIQFHSNQSLCPNQ